MKINLNLSVGDFIDRYSILQIKRKNKIDVSVEISQYEEVLIVNDDNFKYYFSILMAINSQLWDLEDRKRKGVERYSSEESDVSYLITQLNDLRHAVKKKADEFFVSDITEKKSH